MQSPRQRIIEKPISPPNRVSSMDAKERLTYTGVRFNSQDRKLRHFSQEPQRETAASSVERKPSLLPAAQPVSSVTAPEEKKPPVDKYAHI